MNGRFKVVVGEEGVPEGAAPILERSSLTGAGDVHRAIRGLDHRDEIVLNAGQSAQFLLIQVAIGRWQVGLEVDGWLAERDINGCFWRRMRFEVCRDVGG